jgi:hypothetical protein
MSSLEKGRTVDGSYCLQADSKVKAPRIQAGFNSRLAKFAWDFLGI